MRKIESLDGHLLRKLIIESGLDADVIMKVLDDSLSIDLVKWGESRGQIIKLLLQPEEKDIHRLIANSQFLLSPLEHWITMESNLNEMRKYIISKYDYYNTDFRCSQIKNFMLILKLY